MRKLKLILGKGKRESTVVDAETGEDIEGVIGVHIDLDQSTQYTPIATITIAVIDIEAPSSEEVTRK